MASCPRTAACAFYCDVAPSLVKRIKYATSYPFCNTGKHESCALYSYALDGRTPAPGLLPNGTLDEPDEAQVGSGLKVVVVDDSAVFALFAANAVTSCLPHASVVRCDSYAEAAEDLRDGGVGLVVCGYGVGDGRTAHDVRRICSAPMVLLTGRPAHELDLPANSRVVLKGAGPDALRAAIGAAVLA